MGTTTRSRLGLGTRSGLGPSALASGVVDRPLPAWGPGPGWGRPPLLAQAQWGPPPHPGWGRRRPRSRRWVCWWHRRSSSLRVAVALMLTSNREPAVQAAEARDGGDRAPPNQWLLGAVLTALLVVAVWFCVAACRRQLIDAALPQRCSGALQSMLLVIGCGLIALVFCSRRKGYERATFAPVRCGGGASAPGKLAPDSESGTTERIMNLAGV